MSDGHSPGVEEARPNGFGWRHAGSIFFAVAVTVTIFIFRNQIFQLQELAYLGAFLTMLLGNATVILGVPGLVIVFALGSSLNPLLVGLAAGPGAALGEMTAYAAGYGGSGVVQNTAAYRTFKRWMDRYGLVAVMLLAAIPNPVFDIAGLIAGASKIKWWQFLIAAWIGKTIQGILVAYAGALSLGWVERLLS